MENHEIDPDLKQQMWTDYAPVKKMLDELHFKYGEHIQQVSYGICGAYNEEGELFCEAQLSLKLTNFNYCLGIK